jgi:hypothetical protein
MATGRIRRTVRRGVAVAVLGWLSVTAASVVLASPAAAAPAVTVPIRDLTPPVASVDAGGTGTFVNAIQDKPVQVGGGLLPTLVSVTAKSEVTLGLPSGKRVLAPGASHTEKFDSSCLTCSITFTYRLQSNASLTSALTDGALKLLHPLPLPAPFVVNTLLPLPNLPGVNLPQLPPLTLPAPPAAGVLPPAAPVIQPPAAPLPSAPLPGAPPAATPVQGVPGSQYTYSIGTGAAQLSPRGGSAAAFDPSRFLANGRNLSGGAGSGSGSGSGSGGQAGTFDGATVPVFGQLAGLDGDGLDEESAGSETSADSASATASLPAAALAAVVALAAASAALVRTHQASRATK